MHRGRQPQGIYVFELWAASHVVYTTSAQKNGRTPTNSMIYTNIGWGQNRSSSCCPDDRVVSTTQKGTVLILGGNTVMALFE